MLLGVLVKDKIMTQDYPKWVLVNIYIAESVFICRRALVYLAHPLTSEEEAGVVINSQFAMDVVSLDHKVVTGSLWFFRPFRMLRSIYPTLMTQMLSPPCPKKMAPLSFQCIMQIWARVIPLTPHMRPGCLTHHMVIFLVELDLLVNQWRRRANLEVDLLGKRPSMAKHRKMYLNSIIIVR